MQQGQLENLVKELDSKNNRAADTETNFSFKQ